MTQTVQRENVVHVHSDGANGRSLLILFVLLLMAWLPAVFGGNAVKSASDLYHLANAANPYFVPDHAVRLYVWTPLVVMSSCILFLSPGLFLSIGLNAAKGIGQWMVTGLAMSVIVVSSAAAIVQALMGSPLRGIAFAFLVVGCSLAGFGFLLVRYMKGRSLAWPFAQPHAFITLLSIVVVPVIILIGLAPKFYWENFNGDGAHAFETARLLLFQTLPFWKPSAGEISSFPGTTSMLFVYPMSWFIRLFGENEVSVRLPLLLYIGVLYGAVIALVGYNKTKAIGIVERGLIWLGLIIYVITMAFSATYSPYSADIALPSTQDTLLMVFFLGFILAFLNRYYVWMVLFIALTYVSLPSGMLMICMWMVSAVIVWKPVPRRQVFITTAALIGCITIAAVAQKLLAANGVTVPGGEYALKEFLGRFAFLQFTDWRRFAYILIPCGILPGIAILFWHWQDRVSRTLTILILLYFSFFYFQAHISLHHFVPVMLLPIVAFWRGDMVVNSRYRQSILIGAGIAGIAAFLIALPQNTSLHMSGRLVGEAIECRIAGYDKLRPAIFKNAEILSYLFPYAWDPNVPQSSYGGSPLIWNYYAHRKSASVNNANYVIQGMDDPPPNDMQLIIKENNAALYVRDKAAWARHRSIRPPTPAGSNVFMVPRGILFRSVRLEEGPLIINMVDLIENMGIDVDPILDRLGVSR